MAEKTRVNSVDYIFLQLQTMAECNILLNMNLIMLSSVHSTYCVETTLRHSQPISLLFSSLILKMAAGMVTREIKTRRDRLFPLAHAEFLQRRVLL